MTAPAIYDCFGEDGDFAYMNGAVGSGVIINTSGSTFRAGYARSSVEIASPYTTVFAQRLWTSGGISSGWFGCRVSSANAASYDFYKFFELTDPSGVPRIQLVNAGGAPSGPYSVFKVSAAGVQTLLGSTSSGFSAAPAVPDKLDVNFDYSASGLLTIYINSAQVFTYAGNITTDSATELGGSNHGTMLGQDPSRWTAWSECVVSDSDTRNMNVRTNAAVGAGTVDNWTGAYTNGNQIAVNDADFDTTTTAGAIQRYTMGTIGTGNEGILAKVTNLRATKGTGSLANIALAEKIGGTAHVTASIAFPTAFGPVQFIQATNPVTGVAWTFSDLNASGRESGVQANT
jgi:hypothetical protein